MAKRRRVARSINWLPLLGERAGVRGEQHELPPPVESPHPHRLYATHCRHNRTLTPALSQGEREPVFRCATPLPLAIVSRYENPTL